MSTVILDPSPPAPPGSVPPYQADTFEAVTRDGLDRDRLLLNLNDPAGIYKERNTLRLVEGARRDRITITDTRYEGEVTSTAIRGNDTLTVTLIVKDELDHQAAAGRVEALLELADRVAASGDLYLLFKPGKLANGVYLPVRGPGTAQPAYDSVAFAGAAFTRVEVSWPVAPLAEGAPMDITDPLGDNPDLEGYTFGPGSTPAIRTVTDGDGLVTPALTAGDASQVAHIGRGYPGGDGEAVAVGRSTAGNAELALTPGLGYLEADGRYLWAALEAGELRIYFYNPPSGSIILAAGAYSAPAADVVHTVALRQTGNLLEASVWPGAAPHRPIAAGIVTFTLTDLTDPPASDMGAAERAGRPLARSWAPVGGRAAVVQEFRWRAYNYPSAVEPRTVILRDVPGSAPAKIAVDVAPADPAVALPFALLAWRSYLTGTARAPFGVILADDDEVAYRSEFASVVYGGTLGGTRMNLNTAVDVAGSLEYLVDPALLETVDPGGPLEVDVELWVMGYLSSTVKTPRIAISTTADGIAAARRYSRETGSVGRALMLPSSGTRSRAWRLGTLTLDRRGNGLQRIRIDATAGSGSTGTIGLEYLLLTPARARAATPSGLINDSAYPTFYRAQADGVAKRIRADLRGQLVSPAGVVAADVGLAGEPLEVPPGDVELLAWTQEAAVPDDPSSSAADANDGGLAVRVAVTPRYRLFNTGT